MSDRRFYTGTTNNLERRLFEHQKGQESFTKNFLPVELVWFSGFKDKTLAKKFEEYLKSGSGQAFRTKHLI